MIGCPDEPRDRPLAGLSGMQKISHGVLRSSQAPSIIGIAHYEENGRDTMAYIKAEDVRSPRGAWTLIQVLFDGGPSTDEEGSWSLSVGEWHGKRRLAARWNGYDEGGSPAGNPSARGFPTWFIVPPEFEKPLMAVVPSDKLALAKALLNQG